MGVSERFACRVTGQHRGTQRYCPNTQSPADPDAALRAWLRSYAREHPRWGHRRAYHDARGEGWAVNHKKLQRLWREEGLRVPQRRRRKRPGTSTIDGLPAADAPNKVWAVDFQFDSTTDGTPRWATRPRPGTLPPAPTNDRLSQHPGQSAGSRQSDARIWYWRTGARRPAMDGTCREQARTTGNGGVRPPQTEGKT